MDDTVNAKGVGKVKYLSPPDDVLRNVFTDDIRAAWRRRAGTSESLRFRLKVLEACGPFPSDILKADEIRFYRAWKAAWETYLLTAFACGMFLEDRGKELRGRLADENEEGFRSAMDECLACWILAGRMKMRIGPYAPGRGGKNLEMGILTEDGWIGIEVKSPSRPPPEPEPGKSHAIWHGDEADKVQQCMDAANRQFSDDRGNILVVVPRLRVPLFSRRDDLVRAAYGRSKITAIFDARTGKCGPSKTEFFPDGRFLNTNRPNGKPLKRDGFPAFRRISAILCIEERIAERYRFPDPRILLDEENRYEIWPVWERARKRHFSRDNYKWIDHEILVLHNPHAYHAVSANELGEFPQFVPVGDGMKWTDGYPVNV